MSQNELLDEFIFDSRDHLGTAGAQLLDLEKHPDSLDALNALMGTMHTIKGNSGFLDLQNLYKLVHHAETLLQTVREKKCPCPQTFIDLLLQVLDTVEALLGRLENGEDDSVEWLEALNQSLADAEEAMERGGQEESPDDGPPQPQVSTANAPRAVVPKKGPIVIKDDLRGKLDTLVIADGQLANEGDTLPRLVEAMFAAGLAGLVVDLRGLSAVNNRELKFLMATGKKNPDKTAFLLDGGRQAALLRVFRVLHLDAYMHFFFDKAAATRHLGAE